MNWRLQAGMCISYTQCSCEEQPILVNVNLKEIWCLAHMGDYDCEVPSAMADN